MENVYVTVRKRTQRQEWAFFWRLMWPGLAFIVVVNTALSLTTGSNGMPVYVSTPGAIGVMLACAWWRDHRGDQLPPLREVIVTGTGPEGVRQVKFGARPNPMLYLPPPREHGPPHNEMAVAVLVEFCADPGPPDVAWLERELDWYLRGKQPMRKPRWPTV